jgi:hypothetical protein
MAQMAQLIKGGFPNYGDFTPASDVNAGDVVLDGDSLVICTGGAKRNGAGVGITAGVLGSVVVRGGYFLCQTDGAIGTRKRVYWNASTQQITLTRGANLQFGFTGDVAATGANQYIPVEFSPGRPDETVTAVAPTGSTIADAAALQDGFNIVTGADGTKGVLLPPASPGRIVKVKNVTAAILKVWPNAAGQAINALGAGNAISMAASTSADFEASSATQWYTNPTVPS